MTHSSKYRFDLDLLKGLAIIAVVLYHIGWLKTGYLGVDVFFAINGFFILPGLLKRIGGGDFQYVTFLLKRVMRLWPLVLIASVISLAVGAWGMLPDDFENLAQAVIATDFMSNNILSAITTKNYWDAVNEYKPLMHFWYVGILIEFYIVMPLVFYFSSMLSKILKKDYGTISKSVIWILFFISLSLYLFSNMSQGDKFYYLPCRLFELLAGGLVGIYLGSGAEVRLSSKLGNIAFVLAEMFMCCSWYLPTVTSGEINSVTGQIASDLLVSPFVLLISSVIVTCIVLGSNNVFCFAQKYKLIQGVGFLGKMSFSIFVWHQILLAFYRYFISDNMTLIFGICLWIVTIILSFISYYGIEQKIKANWRNFGLAVVFMLLTVIPSGLVYLNAGVIRDVPELNIQKGNVHRGMFAEYCDRVYQYNHDFQSTDKIKVLVEGVSFGRDFANILLESEWADKIELSYIFKHDVSYRERYKKCDVLFTFSSKDGVPSYVWENVIDGTKVIGLGSKNFGTCNGVIYQKRKQADYYDQTVEINPNFYTLNEEWKKGWGSDNYIDFLALSTASDGNIRVFTDDHRFISQDCRHLTQAGAEWFAQVMEERGVLNRLFNKY